VARRSVNDASDDDASAEPVERKVIHFGKRSAEPVERKVIHFGKRHAEPVERKIFNFGKRSAEPIQRKIFYFPTRSAEPVEDTETAEAKQLEILPLEEQTGDAAGKDLVCVEESCSFWPKELTALVSSGDVQVENIDVTNDVTLENESEDETETEVTRSRRGGSISVRW